MEHRRYNKGKKIAFVFLGLAFFIIIVFVVMSLWNWLMPAIFGLELITFWQALGLLVLSKILFSSGWFRKPGYGSHGRSSWQWRKRFMTKWEHMSEEEREKIRNRCRPPADENL